MSQPETKPDPAQSAGSPGSAEPSDATADSVTRATYVASGVDVAAGAAALDRIRSLVASTSRPEVLGEIGGFAGAFALDVDRYRRPALVASSDGVGTKAMVASAAGRYDTIGIDLVAMCVDDLVCVGAEPLFLLDYVVSGKLVPEQVEQLVAGVAAGCREVGCALLGGEMAEHPGAMDADEFDLAGFAVGIVERDELLGPERVVDGDVLVGLASPGLRSNGYSLARHVLLEREGRSLTDPAWPGATHSLADELLRPSVLYAPAVLAAVRAGGVHAAAHVTGGGLAANLERVLPNGLAAVVRRATWPTPRIFTEIQRCGAVSDGEMASVFNLGVGMVLVVAPRDAVRVIEVLGGAGRPATVVGAVHAGTDGVALVDGDHDGGRDPREAP